MTKKRLSSRGIEWSTLNAVFTVLIIGFYALCLAVPERWAALYETYGRALIISMAALYFWNMRLRGYFELRVMLFYVAWVYITRVLNGDTYLQNEFDLVLGKLLCFLVMAAAFTLSKKERDRFFDAVIAVYCGVFFVAALLGIFCCIMGCYLVFPPEGVVFGLENELEYHYTNFIGMFSTIRTMSAMWTYAAWCLMTYEFAKTDSRLRRIPIGIAWLVFLFAILMSYSRTVTVSFCVSCAMLAMLIALRKTKKQRVFLRCGICAVCAVLALVASYKATSAVKPVVCSISSAVTAVFPRESNDIVHYHGTVSDNFNDPRDTNTENVKSLSGRTDIYAAALKILRDEPSTLLVGKYGFKIQPSLGRYFPPSDSFPIRHAHNYLFQTLLLTGLIGLAAVLVFTVSAALRMIIFFFSEDKRIRFADKLLTLPITGMFIYSLMEIMIFTNISDERSFGTDLRELMFFLIAGMFFACFYDVFPAFSFRCAKPKQTKEADNG